nr:MAG TPA: hypothetical protein [Caudoviricetes sp.]
MIKYKTIRSGEHEEHLSRGVETIILDSEDYLCDETGIREVLGEFGTLEEAIENAKAYGSSRISAAAFGFYVDVISVWKCEYDENGEYEQGDVQWISPLPAQFEAKNGLIFKRSAWNENRYDLKESKV